MVAYDRYVQSPRQGFKASDRYVHAYRETFLFELINHFDNLATDNEAAAGMSDAATEHVSIAAKRRARNQLYMAAKQYVDEYNASRDEGVEPISVNDTAVLSEVFFETPFGQQYARFKDSFVGSPEYQHMDELARQWTVNQLVERETIPDAKQRPRTRVTISPYDPLFADSSLFDDKHDNIGYVFDKKCLSPDGRYITAVRLGSGQTVAPAASRADVEALVQQLPEEPEILEGISVQSGYSIVDRYIKTADVKDRVRSFLEENVQMGRAPSEDEKSYMRQACEYLARQGYEFDIDVGREDCLVLKLADGNQTEIRLLSPGDPLYQGRIYAQGITTRLSLQNLQKMSDADRRAYVTAEDRMNMLRWELGEQVMVTNSVAREPVVVKGADGKDVVVESAMYPPRNPVNNMPVGMVSVNPIKLSKVGYVQHQSPVAVGTQNTEANSITIAVKAARFQAANGSFYPANEQAVSIMKSTVSTKPENVDELRSWVGEAELSDYFFDHPESYANPNTADNRTGTYINIPVNKLLEGDVVTRSPEGYPVIDFAKDARGVVTTDKAYYRHVVARDKLQALLDSAKQHHSEMVDVPGIIEAYRSVVREFDFNGDEALRPNIIRAKIDELMRTADVPYSDDLNVKEVQELCFNILSAGPTDEWLAVNTTGLSPEEADAAIAQRWLDWYSEDKIAERIEQVNAFYPQYQREHFGQFPEITRPNMTTPVTEQPENGANLGMLCKYATFNGVINPAQVSENVERLLMMLEDDYSHDFLMKDDRMSDDMRDKMVRFNPDHVVASFRYSDLWFEGTQTVDPEAINRIPGLEDRPFTRQMLQKATEGLLYSGCYPESICVRIDEHGIIEYSGVATTRKTINDTRSKAAQAKAKFTPQPSYRDIVESIEAKANADELVAARDEGREPVTRTIDYATFDADRTLTGAEWRDNNLKRVHGYIGQVFEPDRYGAIHLDTETPRDRVIIPGYNAYLAPQDPENPEPMRDRLRLVGIETMMGRQIIRGIRADVFTLEKERRYTSHTADLNSTYSKVYDMAFKRDAYDARVPKDPEHMTAEEKTFVDIIRTLSGRCKFPNEYGEGSTTMAQSYLEHPNEEEARSFDYYYSDLCDNWNMRVLGPQFDGMFDPDMTGTAKTQGIVRYLAEGTKVDPDTGRVTPAEMHPGEELPRCPIMKDPLFRNKNHDSWDRRLMAGSQIISCLGVIRDTGTAMMTLQGLNMDDGMVISRAVAEAYPQVGADGRVRPLGIQDKLSDFHGNKGVISKVIDPALYSENIREAMLASCGDGEAEGSGGAKYAFDVMNADGLSMAGDAIYDRTQRDFIVRYNGEEYPVRFSAKANTPEGRQAALVASLQKTAGVDGLDPTLKLFSENPNLGVVMAPYSGMSRFNGGSVRDMMDNARAPETLIVDGKPVEGGMGYTNFIIVDMLADVKTHWYDEEAVREGHGRKASGQLAWALQSKGANHIMREFYGDNISALNDLREYAIATGFDITPTLEPAVGYQGEANGEKARNLLKLPSVEEMRGDPVLNGTAKTPDAEPTLFAKAGGTKMKPAVVSACRERCMDMLNTAGGFMELPFPLMFNAPDKAGLDFDKLEGVERYHFELHQTGQTVTVGGKEIPTYGMPVLSHHLRNGQEFEDGTVMVHEYTTKYLAIHKFAVNYLICRDAYEREPDGTEFKAQLKAEMEAAQASAQSTFNDLTSNIIARRFDTKHNVIRDRVMASRLSGSATAVWSADPRLDLDEIAMSTEHAKMLGILDDNGKFRRGMQSVMVWRDPILHDDNVRYMRVRLDDTVVGVTVNPMMDKCFDGDYDGDSVAIVALHGTDAQIEARNCFSVAQNLIQKGVVLTDENGNVRRDEKGNALHPLYLQTGLDVTANMAANPVLKEEFDQMTLDANALSVKQRECAQKLAELQKAIAKEHHGGPAVSEEARQEAKEMQDAVNVESRDLMKRLNAWAKFTACGIATTPHYEEMRKTADPTLGTDHLIFKDDKTFITSVQHIVEDGAKGNASKMRDFMRNVGIAYETDEDGKPVLSSVKAITHEVDGELVRCPRDTADKCQRKVDMEIQETTAYKADNTALGGTSAQNGVSAFRDTALTPVLELTYPITQAILQSKHDPKDAKIKDEIVRFWGKDVWDGYKLTGNFTGSPEEIQGSRHRRIGRPVVTKSGREVMEYEFCSLEEWKEQMVGMMKALKVDVNPDYIDHIGTVMLQRPTQDDPTPRVAGFQRFGQENGSLLDKMAYRGRFKAFAAEACKIGRASILPGAYFLGKSVQEKQSAVRSFKRTPETAAEWSALKYDYSNAVHTYAPSASFVPVSFEKSAASPDSGRVLGDADCYVTEETLKKGFGIMGETMENYRARTHEAVKEQTETVQVTTSLAPEIVGGNPFLDMEDSPNA